MFHINIYVFLIKKISDLLIPSFLMSDVSESLRSLTKNERCEIIAQVAHKNWATMSDLHRLLRGNEWSRVNRAGRSQKMSKWANHCFFWVNHSFAHFFTKYLLIRSSLICSFFSNQMSNCERFAQIGQDNWATVRKLLSWFRGNERPWVNRSGCSRQMSDHEQFAQVAQRKWANERFAQKILAKKI